MNSNVYVTIRNDSRRRIPARNGSSPCKRWFDRLGVQAAAKVATAIARLAGGNTGSIKWLSGLGEIRIDWGPGYRVYLAKDGETLIVLFGGGTKATQNKDILQAKELLRDYKLRKREQVAQRNLRNKR